MNVMDRKAVKSVDLSFFVQRHGSNLTVRYRDLTISFFVIPGLFTAISIFSLSRKDAFSFCFGVSKRGTYRVQSFFISNSSCSVKCTRSYEIPAASGNSRTFTLLLTKIVS